MPFGIDRARLDAITSRHEAALVAADRTIVLSFMMDKDLPVDEAMQVLKWLSAVRFAKIIQGEDREPNHGDFVELTDAVCEACK